MNIDKLIADLIDAKKAIQVLENFIPTEHNCRQILGSIQRIDACILALRKMKSEEVSQNG